MTMETSIWFFCIFKMVDQIHGLKTFIFIVFFLDVPIHPSIICLDPSKKWPTDFLFQVCSQFRAETRGETLGSRWLIEICWRNISSYSHDITMINNILIYIYNDNYVMVYNGSSWQPPWLSIFHLGFILDAKHDCTVQGFGIPVVGLVSHYNILRSHPPKLKLLKTPKCLKTHAIFRLNHDFWRVFQGIFGGWGATAKRQQLR